MILLWTRDLMIASSLHALSQATQTPVHVHSDSASLLRAIDQHLSSPFAHESAMRVPPFLVVLDLQSPGLQVESLVPELRTRAGRQVKIVAFGPHVQTARLQASAEAGCDVVLTRGPLTSALPDIWKQHRTGAAT